MDVSADLVTSRADAESLRSRLNQAQQTVQRYQLDEVEADKKFRERLNAAHEQIALLKDQIVAIETEKEHGLRKDIIPESESLPTTPVRYEQPEGASADVPLEVEDDPDLVSDDGQENDIPGYHRPKGEDARYTPHFIMWRLKRQSLGIIKFPPVDKQNQKAQNEHWKYSLPGGAQKDSMDERRMFKLKENSDLYQQYFAGDAKNHRFDSRRQTDPNKTWPANSDKKGKFSVSLNVAQKRRHFWYKTLKVAKAVNKFTYKKRTLIALPATDERHEQGGHQKGAQELHRLKGLDREDPNWWKRPFNRIFHVPPKPKEQKSPDDDDEPDDPSGPPPPKPRQQHPGDYDPFFGVDYGHPGMGGGHGGMGGPDISDFNAGNFFNSQFMDSLTTGDWSRVKSWLSSVTDSIEDLKSDDPEEAGTAQDIINASWEQLQIYKERERLFLEGIGLIIPASTEAPETPAPVQQTTPAPVQNIQITAATVNIDNTRADAPMEVTDEKTEPGRQLTVYTAPKDVEAEKAAEEVIIKHYNFKNNIGAGRELWNRLSSIGVADKMSGILQDYNEFTRAEQMAILYTATGDVSGLTALGPDFAEEAIRRRFRENMPSLIPMQPSRSLSTPERTTMGQRPMRFTPQPIRFAQEPDVVGTKRKTRRELSSPHLRQRKRPTSKKTPERFRDYRPPVAKAVEEDIELADAPPEVPSGPGVEEEAGSFFRPRRTVADKFYL